MNLGCSNAAQKLYVRRTLLITAAYLLVVTLVAVVFKTLHPTGPLAWAVAVFTALPTLGFLAITGLYLRDEKDEFLRTVQVYSMLGGIGLTLAVTTTWGFLEDFAHAPRLDLTWIYPIFWIAAALSYVVVWSRYSR